MKYTRRSIIKKAGSAGLILFMPEIIKAAYRLKESDKNQLRETLEKWEVDLKGIDQMADIVIINDNSVKEFDMVAMSYNRDKDCAPVVLFSKNEEWKPKNKIEINIFIKEIERFAERNKVYISYLNSEETLNDINRTNLIKKIKDCGMFNEISEDLYRPVSFFYFYRTKYFDRKD